TRDGERVRGGSGDAAPVAQRRAVEQPAVLKRRRTARGGAEGGGGSGRVGAVLRLGKNDRRLCGPAEAERSGGTNGVELSRREGARDDNNLVEQAVHIAQSLGLSQRESGGDIWNSRVVRLGGAEDGIRIDPKDAVATRCGQMIPGIGDRGEGGLGQEARSDRGSVNMEIQESAAQRKQPLVEYACSFVLSDEDSPRLAQAGRRDGPQVCPERHREIIGPERERGRVWSLDEVIRAIEVERLRVQARAERGAIAEAGVE